jgi:hypothetical protein
MAKFTLRQRATHLMAAPMLAAYFCQAISPAAAQSAPARESAFGRRVGQPTSPRPEVGRRLPTRLDTRLNLRIDMRNGDAAQARRGVSSPLIGAPDRLRALPRR